MEIYLQLFLYHLHSLTLFRIVTYHNILETTKFLSCFFIHPRIIGRGAEYNKLNKHGAWAFQAIAVKIENINMIAKDIYYRHFVQISHFSSSSLFDLRHCILAHSSIPKIMICGFFLPVGLTHILSGIFVVSSRWERLAKML